RVTAELSRRLGGGGARLEGVSGCPPHPGGGGPRSGARWGCRKPSPGLLLRAAADLGLDLRASVMVGDKLSDVAAGHAAGTAGVLVLSGYGRGEWEYRAADSMVVPDHVADNLLGAAEWALDRAATARPAASR